MPRRLQALIGYARSHPSRAGFVSFAMSAVIALVVFGGGGHRKPTGLTFFRTSKDGQAGESPSYNHADFRLDSVWGDGRYAAFHTRQTQLPSNPRYFRWYFDVKARQFVGTMSTAEKKWPPGPLLVEREKRNNTIWRRMLSRIGISMDEELRYETRIHRLDFERKRTRLLCRWTSNKHETGSAFPWGLSRDGRRLVFSVVRRLGQHGYESRLVVFDPHTKRERVLEFQDASFAPISLFPRSWLSDDRTLVLYDRVRIDQIELTENLYLVDTHDLAPETPPRQVPILGPCREFFKMGDIARGGDIMPFFEPLSVMDNGDRCRVIAWSENSHSPEVTTGTVPELPAGTSIWDLDVASGELRKRLDLGRGDGAGPLVVSPSGRSIVGPFGWWREDDSAAEDLVSTSTSAIRPLPSDVTRAAELRSLQFLNEHTLIYTAAPYDIRTYDLRTGRTKLLFRPR